jgi:hypothetical protein
VKNYLADVSTVSGVLLCMAPIQQIELRSKACTGHMPFRSRHGYTAGEPMTSRITDKHLDEVNRSAKVQASHGVPDLMPAPVLIAIDKDRHGIWSATRASLPGVQAEK